MNKCIEKYFDGENFQAVLNLLDREFYIFADKFNEDRYEISVFVPDHIPRGLIDSLVWQDYCDKEYVEEIWNSNLNLMKIVRKCLPTLKKPFYFFYEEDNSEKYG